jgi:TatD DNase family protein
VLIDSHCHLDMPAFDLDREAAWERARAAGVEAVLIPGVEPARWDATIALARNGERFVALGIHPQVLPELDPQAVRDGLHALASRAREAGAVAIGECGFDGGIDLARAPMERQCEVMAAHVEVARAMDLPLVVHVLRAHADALAFFRRIELPRQPGVIHSYSGSAEQVREYHALGFHISFAGSVTRPNARKPALAARAVALDRLLIETDAPDQTPTGAPPSGPSGRRCEPAHLEITARRIAELRDIPFDQLCKHTRDNARRLFRLPL